MKSKIAVFHNYMDNIGGAEIVGLTLARELNADFYSTNIDREKIQKMGFSDITLKSVGPIPIDAPYRQQMALCRFRLLNLKGKYDYFIIDGDWAMSGSVNNKPNLWYVHSPIREIWDLYEYTRQNTVSFQNRLFFDLWVYYNRYLNRKFIKHVGKIACNSLNTQRRVEKYLKREATVIYPPTDTSQYYFGKSGDYWLSVNRLVSHKRVDTQIEAFKMLPNERLIIVGSYEQSEHFRIYVDYIKSIQPKNVEILHWVDKETLIDLYANCKGFITTSKDEDFGMTPIEAMASGKPVIAPNEGGYKETVIDGLTGRLIDNINVYSLAEAIKEVGKNLLKFKSSCIDRAKQFDTAIFMAKVKALINS
ncbi:MAG: glycosyltransferase [Candidatus Omnitrophica bacterium]|nr:glycosyltransferase [Candidatus Omnitrophota bacterium]